MDLRTFQQLMSQAPGLLEQIGVLFQECQEKDIQLPKGIKNLCEMTWEELSDIPPDAKPLHQSRAGPRSLYAPNINHPLDTQNRITMTPSHVLLPASSMLSPRQSVVAVNVTKVKRRLLGDRDNNAFVPITSTLRLHLEEYLSHLSFSLSYKAVSSEGSNPYLSYSTLEVCKWALRIMGTIQVQIKEEAAILQEKGHTHPLTTRNYLHCKVLVPPPPTQPYAKDFLFPLIPNIKQLLCLVPYKLHYSLPDRTTFLFYPSGSVAVCQVPCQVPNGGVYTIIFNSNCDTLLAIFKPNGCGFVHHAGKSTGLALFVTSSECQQYTREGCLIKKVSVSAKAPREVLHSFTVNENMTLTLSNHMAMSLTFSAMAEEITLCVKKEHMPVSTEAEEAQPEGIESTFIEAEASRTTLQGIRKRVRETSLCWLGHYLIAAGIIKEPEQVDHKPKPTKRKEAWSTNSRISASIEKSPPAINRPPKLRRKVLRPVTCYQPLFQTTSQRAKSADLPRISSLSALPPCDSPYCPSCPSMLRLLLLDTYTYQGCHCFPQLPTLSDLELDVFLKAPWSPQGQVLVVYVTSSAHPPPGAYNVESIVKAVYRKQMNSSATPCVKSSKEPFRLVKYDTDMATRLTKSSVPILVQRHHVGPGTLLMYVGGKLIFGGSTLNGYGFSKANLLKQIAKTQKDYTKGNSLPQDYKLESWETTHWFPQSRSAQQNKRGRYSQDNALKTQSLSSHRKENFLPGRPLDRGQGGSALDFVVSRMSDRESILDMKSKRRTRASKPQHTDTLSLPLEEKCAEV